MSLDINEIDDQTLTDIMDNMETERAEDVAGLSAGEAIDKFLTWNGIMGFTGMITEGIDSIRAAATIHEIRTLVNPPDGSVINADEIFTDVVNCFDHHGHMGNETLKLVGLTLQLAITPTGRSLALLKIREVIG
jgi:hypothetical protein